MSIHHVSVHSLLPRLALTLILLASTLLLIAIPQAQASEYPVVFSSRRGSEVVRILALARFLVSQSRKYPTDFDVSADVLQSMRRILPEDRGGAFHVVLSQKLSLFFGIPDEEVIIALTAKVALPSENAETLEKVPVTIRVSRDRFVTSTNPVWNACVRSSDLSFDLIQSNTDRFHYRRRALKTSRPWSCRDYHRGKENVWLHPDFPMLRLILDKKGRYLAWFSDTDDRFFDVRMRKSE